MHKQSHKLVQGKGKCGENGVRIVVCLSKSIFGFIIFFILVFNQSKMQILFEWQCNSQNLENHVSVCPFLDKNGTSYQLMSIIDSVK